jgi:N-acetylglutamate synthase-like GNAT family acetyltransferase
VQIRSYMPSDRAGVIALILPIQREEFGIPITLEAQPDLQTIPEFYQTRRGGFWVAVEEESVVGSIALLDIGDDCGALRKMFVHRDYRGDATGVARGLLETLSQHCAEHDVARIYLGTTVAYLAAHRFYEKNGFVEIALGDLPATFPIMQVDTKFYRRIIA